MQLCTNILRILRLRRPPIDSRRLASTVVRPLILGIETSCDDTGAALVDGAGRIYGECLNSQQNTHLR